MRQAASLIFLVVIKLKYYGNTALGKRDGVSILERFDKRSVSCVAAKGIVCYVNEGRSVEEYGIYNSFIIINGEERRELRAACHSKLGYLLDR